MLRRQFESDTQLHILFKGALVSREYHHRKRRVAGGRVTSVAIEIVLYARLRMQARCSTAGVSWRAFSKCRTGRE